MTRARLLLATFSGVTWLLFQVSACADTFDFSYGFVCGDCGSNGVDKVDLFTSASGVLTTTSSQVNGALLITGITGHRTTNYFLNNDPSSPITSTITGLVPPDPSNP